MNGQALQVARGRMGEILWREAPVEADLVIAVPDSGNPAARGLARAAGLPQDDGFVKNRYVARTFIQPGQELRKHGLRLKFNPLPEVIAGKRLVVVDDSIVRGNTTRQIVQMLRDAGAARGAHAHLRAADQAPLPLRHRHVHARGDDRARPHHRRRSPPSSAATRCTTSRWRASTRRSARPRETPLRRLLHRRVPARRHRRGERQVRAGGAGRVHASARARVDGFVPADTSVIVVDAMSDRISSPEARFPIAVLVSGAGTNLQALLDTVHGREAQIVAVASSVADAPALERAGARIPTAVFSRAHYPDRGARDEALADWLPGAARGWSCSPATWSCSASASSSASPGRSSTCTPRCCRPSRACARSSRRSRTG